MTSKISEEALARAREGAAVSNLPAIYAGFIAKGIPEDEILPRENVLTYHAWRALGRHVRKGEHGVRIVTWIPIPDKLAPDGSIERLGGKRAKGAYVFHISQTDPDAAPAEVAENAA